MQNMNNSKLMCKWTTILAFSASYLNTGLQLNSFTPTSAQCYHLCDVHIVISLTYK
jgi:hypothetical protein